MRFTPPHRIVVLSLPFLMLRSRRSASTRTSTASTSFRGETAPLTRPWHRTERARARTLKWAAVGLDRLHHALTLLSLQESAPFPLLEFSDSFPPQDFSDSFSTTIIFRLFFHSENFPTLFPLQEFPDYFPTRKNFPTLISSSLSPKRRGSGKRQAESGAGARREVLPGGKKLVARDSSFEFPQ